MGRFAGQQIESWNPAVDIRSVEAGRLFILDGKNYLFDSKGPKSGFGNRLVRGGAIGSGTDVQSVDVGKETLIFSSDGAWRQVYANDRIRDVLEPSTYWQQLKVFEHIQDLPFADSRWTGAYINGIAYVGNPWRGLYRIGPDQLVLHDKPGVPANPIAIAELAGRLLVVTGSAFVFSGVGDGNDFIPELGGAGYQATNQYMSGAPVGLTVFSQGCVVWSRTSAMVVEHIGGENVFRYEALKSKLYPLNATSITSDVNGRSFMMTRHGLVIVEGDRIDESVTPAFNQFIRDYLNQNWDVKIRLDYILEDDLLHVQIADTLRGFNHTFVLNVGIDRWGSFDETHLGVCRFGQQRGSTGFTDMDGYVRKWTGTPDRELKPGLFTGLDSFIEIGYFNAPDMVPHADATLEMQELKTSAIEAFPKDAVEINIDWMGDPGEWWDRVSNSGTSIFDDWNDYQEIINDPEGVETFPPQDWGGSGDNDPDEIEYPDPISIFEDWFYPMDSIAIDQNEDVGDDEDWSAMTQVDPTPSPGTGGGTILDPNEDWQTMEVAAEDWNATSVDPPADWGATNILEGTYLGGNEDWNEPLIYGTDEDWTYRNGYPNPIDVEPTYGDWGKGDIDQSEDWQYSFFIGYPIDTPDWTVDLQANTLLEIDFNGKYSLYNKMDYKLTWFGSFNGVMNDIVIQPELALTQFNRDLWVGLTAGRFQSVKFEATQRWEKFHVTSLDATVVYEGHYS